MFNILINNQPLAFQTRQFAGGEEHITLAPIELNDTPAHVRIFALLTNSSQLVQLLLLVDALKRQFTQIATFELELPYIPYARQDRVCNPGESFSLKVFTELINQCHFSTVYVDDPHSDVAPALLERCVIRPQHQLLVDYCQQQADFRHFVNSAQLVSPDAGSNKKILSVCKALNKDSFIRADKIRDVATGRITETTVYADKIDSNVLIVDDICDGGRTFVALAQVLKEKGAKQVGLYVTHGIFSHGKDNLLQAGIDAIFSLHDWTINE